MKNQFARFILIAMLLMVLSSCRKDEPNITSNVSLDDKQITLRSLSQKVKIPIIHNPINLNDQLSNPFDADDEKINKQKHKIALAFLPFIKDNSLNEEILTKAKANKNNAIKLKDLLESSKINSKKYLESDIVKLKKLVKDADFTHKSQKPKDKFKTAFVQEYIPAIFVPNIEVADPNMEPILSYGVEIDNDVTGLEMFENYIIAWYYDENGNQVETLLSEETAMQSPNPIYIIDNATEALTQTEAVASVFKSTISTSYVKKIIDEYQINYRYDKSKRSEYSYELVYIGNTGGTSYGGYRTEIAEIHKDDVGKVMTSDFEIWQLKYISNLYGVALVTFEYDWFTSRKDVLLSCIAGSFTIRCRMTYEDEYYQALFTEMQDPLTTNYNKGYIKIINQ